MNNEAQARLRINKMLEDTGWRLLDSEEGRANVKVEENVDINKLGDDFENAQHGKIDYLLLDDNDFPLAVLEAKRESIHPLSAKEQARAYARGKNIRFVILSNGISHYLWDLEDENGNPQIITEFPTQQSLLHRKDYKENIQDLADYEVDKHILGDKITLRDYQLEAIHAIQASAREGKKRYLLEMATGTGKTSVAAAVCKLFLKSGNAKRILFLVDRIELEDQAYKALSNLFSGEYFVGTVKQGQWSEKHIVISTVQTLLSNNRYRKEFSPTDFELVISDEAHRSLGGNSRAVFEYFIGYKLGLTATPKDYLRGVDEQDLATKNIKALERRNLLDTYKTFGCENGEPTFRYDLKRGVEDGYLINPYVIDARTNITTELLSEEGYTMETEDGEEENLTIRDFERKYFNENTNIAFAKAILDKGLRDPITGEFGKTIVFCVSQKHAAKITNILNQLASQKWPGKYNSDFAVQITSWVQQSQQFTKDFANNRLMGRSQFAIDTHPGYTTSKARVAVTVGMMTTGYDCPDLLNIAMLRPVFSPADFVQMKGRGTRKHIFKDVETGEEEKKRTFNLLDFFGNYEFFEKDYQYDEAISLPQLSTNNSDKIGEPQPSPEIIIDESDDEVAQYIEIDLAGEGMKIDKELYRSSHEQFEQVLRQSKTIQEILKNKGVGEVEEFVKAEVFNKPTEYWTAQKIRNSYEREYQTQRKISLLEMILKALGKQSYFKSREERLDEEFQKFVDIEKPQFPEDKPELINATKNFFEFYLSDSEFRDIIRSGQYGRLSTYQGFSMSDLQTLNGFITPVKSYVDEYLPREMAEFDWRDN